MTDDEQIGDDQSATKTAASSSPLPTNYGDNIDDMKDYLKKAIESKQSFSTQELIDLAKSSKEATALVKELINLNQLDDTELADRIAKEIISDIEEYADLHLKRYQKYTLNAPQMTSNVDGSRAKFFNLISLLRDVSILGRKLLETSPRFELLKPKTTAAPQAMSNLNPMDKKWLLGPTSTIYANSLRDTKSQMSEDDATSDDLLAALIESSSSDDFLVLSSSLDSITNRDMIVAALILITSHECFTLSHDIQGVVMVLRRAKFMIKNILTPRNQMELITKLLTSIRRYNEMNYVFDLFRDRNQFEILLSKGVEKTPELRIALFNYVKKNPEFYALVTLNFSMFREIAESLEASATKRLDKLILGKRDKQKNKKKMSLITSGASTSVSGGGVGIISTKAAAAARVGSGAKQSRIHQNAGGISVGWDDHSSGVSAQSIVRSSSNNSMTKSNSIETDISNLGGVSGSRITSRACASGGNCGSNNKPLYPRESLNICLVEMVDASDCYAKAGCYKRADNCESKAKLIALQLALLTPTTEPIAEQDAAIAEINVLDLQQSELNDSIVSFESFFDACIVAEAYNYHLAWRQALFRNVVLRGQSTYLRNYCSRWNLSSSLVMELVLLYKQYINNAHNHHRLSHEEITRLATAMKSILARLEDVELRCKLYTQLQFDDAKEELLRNPSIWAHLKDIKLA